MSPDVPPLRDLVLVGGGHAHALVLRMWGMNPLPGTRLTVINPDPVAPYTGMLPGLVAGHYQRCALMIDLVRLARFAGARLILDRATGLDPGSRVIHLAGRGDLAYDIASLDVGITSDQPGIPGAKLHAVAAKPLGAYAAAWERFLALGLQAPRVVILGAGLAGVELALASAHALRLSGAAPAVSLIEAGGQFLPGLSAAAARKLRAELAGAGVDLRLGRLVEEIGPHAVRLTSGEQVATDFTVLATGARPLDWLAGTGLAKRAGFVVTDARLRTSDPQVFAVGDCATIEGDARPKAGVFAVRAAPVLHHNLRAVLSGRPLRAFRPQRDYLKLVSLGGKAALAEKWGMAIAAPALWRVKDRIDRRFMARFEDYPAMALAKVTGETTEGLGALLDRRPLCGGCGAKLGPGVLGAALGGLPSPKQPEVLSGPGDDAAVLARAEGLQVLTTDHLRGFSPDAWLVARVAALHALGDVWAMGATPEVALAQVILPRLGPELQGRMLAEIMTVAAEVFGAAGADVVGGHSSEGAELTVGFTVTGTARRVIGKAGAQAGDALILTKPLGSGVILAAEMAGARAPGLLVGEVWAECIGQMLRGQGSAAGVLAPAAHAMTDVTGFGLAGHLLEMLAASGTAAELRLADVPLMRGALDLSQAGLGSSLLPANLTAVSGRMTTSTDPRARLLADPQTAGGLLAAVPRDRAAGLVAALRSAGHDAAAIGQVTDGMAGITLVA
jgi:selenide, water dikinase